MLSIRSATSPLIGTLWGMDKSYRPVHQDSFISLVKRVESSGSNLRQHDGGGTALAQWQDGEEPQYWSDQAGYTVRHQNRCQGWRRKEIFRKNFLLADLQQSIRRTANW